MATLTLKKRRPKPAPHREPMSQAQQIIAAWLAEQKRPTPKNATWEELGRALNYKLGRGNRAAARRRLAQRIIRAHARATYDDATSE